MKNILLPTDFSDNSINAINYAIDLFYNKECSFHILNVQKQSDFVLDDFMTESSNTTVHNTIAKDNKTKLKEFSENIKKEHPNKELDFNLLFDFDNLIHAIKEAISYKNIDLIIMGSNGATGTREIIFGSNTLNVIRKVNCPVLVIPENYKFKKVNSILFSSEDCKAYTKQNTKLLQDLVKENKATLSVADVSFLSKNTSEKSFLDNIFDVEYNYFKIKDVPESMAVRTIIQLFNYEIYALFINTEFTFLDRFLYTSKDQEISYKTKIPLLVLRE